MAVLPSGSWVGVRVSAADDDDDDDDDEDDDEDDDDDDAAAGRVRRLRFWDRCITTKLEEIMEDGKEDIYYRILLHL